MKASARFDLDSIESVKVKELPGLRKLLAASTERTRERYVLSMPPDGTMGIIAEVKKSSPTRPAPIPVDPIERARSYCRGGALAVSVLTDGSYFSGSWEDLRNVADSVTVPVLCKEFVFFEEQVELAHRYGADMVLLIARVLPPERLRELCTAAREMGITPLMEIHNENELNSVLELEPELLMANMRNLKTLAIDRAACTAALRKIPDGITRICASGISEPAHVNEIFRETGTRIFLVGSSLMSSSLPEIHIKELSNVC